MAGNLIKIDSDTASSSASISLGASDWDNSYDVYMLKINNMQVQTTNTAINMRFLAGGSAQSTTNYDTAALALRSNAAPANNALGGGSYSSFFITYIGASNVAAANFNGIFYLFNMNDSSQFSFHTMEVSTMQNGGTVNEGQQGGGVYRVTEAHNGVQIFCTAGNITAGSFALYGLKK